MATKQEVLSLRERCPDLSIQDIAAKLNCKDAYVRATLARANGYKPPARIKPEGISPEEQTERAVDERDLDIISDLREGHSHADCAEFWGVSKSYVQKLAVARNAA